MTFLRKNILGILMIVWAVAMALSVTSVRAEIAETLERKDAIPRQASLEQPDVQDPR